MSVPADAAGSTARERELRPASLQQAVTLHGQGQLAAAELLYRGELARTPDHSQVLQLLGILSMQTGRIEEGIELLERSLRANPQQPAVALNLARACLQAGRHEAALRACDHALALAPDLDESLYLRGDALLLLRQPAAALASYEQLLARAPTHVQAWSNRGNALQQLGEPDRAVGSYDRALALQPQLAETHYNRGNALRALGRLEAALASYQQSVRLRPDSVDAHIGHGNAARDLGHAELALASYQYALALDPQCGEALSNRGNALLDLGRYREAIESYDAALRLIPDSPDILANRATALQESGNYELAADCLARLLQLAPDYDYALGRLIQSQIQLCNWDQLAQHTQRLQQGLARRARVVHPFSMLAVSSSASTQRLCAELHVERMRNPGIQAMERAELTTHARHKLRLAYVSADLREHAVSYLMAGVFEQHDRQRFETTAISLRPASHCETGERVRAAFDRFEDVSGCSDREIARLMRERGIDIAVDLMGYTRHARPGVFALRAAPVQVNYLGYPGSLGSPFIDYIVADGFLIPPQSRRFYSEQIVYLPECFQANDDRRLPAVQPTRADVGLPQHARVWCSFNNSYKLNPPVFDTWMRLLRESSDSVLWLLGQHAATQANLRREAAARGVEAERLVFAERLPYAQHLARLGLADLCLDTLPYNGGSSTSDALRVGVPVLTCAGEAFAARMAGSLLHALGLPELVTHSLEDYQRRALELARHPAELFALRARLLEPGRRAALFDSARCCRYLERAYLHMHQRSLRGQPPLGFDVPLMPATAATAAVVTDY